MNNWRLLLKYDPIPALLGAPDEALNYFVRRGLLDEDPGSVDRLWQLPAAQKLLRVQLPSGTWDRPEKEKKHPAINYALVETYRQLRFLVDMYGFTRLHPAIERAAEFVFSCQSELGDLRGILANQYANYYTGAILGLLVKAGYDDDSRVDKGLQWLISNCQDDGGWSESLISNKLSSETIYRLSSEYAEPLPPDRTKPFSHTTTGMVLRAFSAHPIYRHCEAALTAAGLLKSRFFQPDLNTSYQAASYWVRFEYPFWWNNLVSALDSISLIDPTIDTQVQGALDWLVQNQQADGLWKATYVPGKDQPHARTEQTRLWVSLAICRVLRRLGGGSTPFALL